MKPLGRKYYKCNTGSKHHVRSNGKYECWWKDVCTPNKTRDIRIASNEIAAEVLDVLIPEYQRELSAWFCSYEELEGLTHEVGTCMKCDWRRQHDKATGWDDPNFIEAWDYKEIWLHRKRFGI